MAKGVKVDISEMKELQKRLNRLKPNDWEDFCGACAKELAARLLRKTQKRTPVDTGTLRRRWTIGEIQKNGDEYTVEVTNPVDYASYVEYGHRTRGGRGWVNGRFMLTVSEHEIQDIAPRLLEKRLEDKLREAFGH